MQSSPTPLKIAVVGAGNIVTGAHLPVIANLPGVSLAWIADRDAARARIVAGNYGTLAVGEDVLERKDLPAADIILLAIPYGPRRAYYERFKGLATGWYVEKPFAKTAAEHRELCSFAPAYGMACGFQRRASGMVRVARELIQSGVFGRPERVEIGLGYRGRIVDGGGYAADPRQAGGGVLTEVGTHCVDAVLHLLDARTVSLQTARTVLDQGMDIHTEATVAVATAGAGEVGLDLKVSILEDTSESIVIHCEHATLEFSIFGQAGITVRPLKGGSGPFQISDPRELYPRSSDQIFYAYWSAFVDGWRRREANFTAAADCVLTTQIVEDIYAHAHSR